MEVLPLYKEYRSLSFLPLCHIFERAVTYTYVGVGVGVYYAESMETIADNLKGGGDPISSLPFPVYWKKSMTRSWAKEWN